MKYHGCTYLRSLSCRSQSDLHFPCTGSLGTYQNRAELRPLTGEPVSAPRSQCRNPFCHPRVTLCSVLSGSTIPFPGSEGKSVKISVLGGIPSATTSAQLQSLVLWLRLFSWHFILTLVTMALPLRSGTMRRYSLLAGILRDRKTAGKSLSGKKEKKKEQNKNRQQHSVLSLCLDSLGLFFFLNILTCSVLCMSESVMVPKDAITLLESTTHLIQSKPRCNGSVVKAQPQRR